MDINLISNMSISPCFTAEVSKIKIPFLILFIHLYAIASKGN